MNCAYNVGYKSFACYPHARSVTKFIVSKDCNKNRY